MTTYVQILTWNLYKTKHQLTQWLIVENSSLREVSSLHFGQLSLQILIGLRLGETRWKTIYIALHRPDLLTGKQRTYGQLRSIVLGACESIIPEYFKSLIETMSAGGQTAIAAQGGHIKY